jgi:uncharacterized protein (DUF1330 family)
MKAYLVLDLSVNNFAGFRKYIAEIPAFIAKHSGKYLVQGAEPTAIEGDWKPERMVIIEFPERKNAESFLGRPANSGPVQGAPRDDDEQAGARRWVYVNPRQPRSISCDSALPLLAANITAAPSNAIAAIT